MQKSLEQLQAENEKLELEVTRMENEQLQKKLNTLRYGSNRNSGSKIFTNPDNQSMSMSDANQIFEEFAERYIDHAQKKGFDIKGRSYEQILEELSYRRV